MAALKFTPLSTDTYEGVPDGMNLNLPAQSLADTEARYLQDILVDKPGLIRRRGPVQAIAGLASFPKPASGLFQTLDPNGVNRFAGVYGDNASANLGLLSADGSTITSIAWNGTAPTGPYLVVDSKAALTDGTWIGTSSRYDSASPVQTLAHWRGGNKANYTTGTLTVARGSTAVTGAGTSWLANVVAGMFIFANTNDPYTNAYLGVVKSVNSDTSITLGAPALYACTAKAYTMQSVRGWCDRIVTGRLTTNTGSTAATGAATKFKTQGMGTGTWDIYQASDLTWVGKVSSVTNDTNIVLAANATIAMNNARYIAFQADGDYSINTQAVADRKMGFITATYATRQWYANNGQQFAYTNRVYFSDPSDPEAVDLSPFDGDFIPIASSSGINTPIKALMPAYNALVVFKDTETFGIFGNSPTTFQAKKIEDDGTLSGMSVQPYGGGVIWAGRSGIHMYDGIQATNLTQEKLGDYYKNMVRAFNPSTYRMWSMIARDHYFLFIENAQPSVPVIKGLVATTPTKLTIVLNLVTKAITMFDNVNIRGSIVLPADTGETTWFLTNGQIPGGSTDLGYICNSADLFDTTGTDQVFADYGATTPAWTNLIPNGSFETNLTGWGKNQGTETTTQDTLHPSYGTHTMKIVTLGGGDEGPELSPRLPVSPNTTYTLSAMVTGALAGQLIYLQAWDRTAGGSQLVRHQSAIQVLGTSPQLCTLTFTTGATAATTDIVIATSSTDPLSGGSQTFWVDGVQVETGTVAHGFVQGSGNGLGYSGLVGGPDFYIESKKYAEGDSLRKKLYKQIIAEYLLQGGALMIDTVLGLNNLGATSTTEFPGTVYTWDGLPAIAATWDLLDTVFPTWDSLIISVFKPKRIKFLKRNQHLAFRIYQQDASSTSVVFGPFQLGYKYQRPGRV